MNKQAQVIKDTILSLTMDIEFVYDSKFGSICPFSPNDISITYNDKTTDFTDVNAAMRAPIFGGKCLNDIADRIEW